MRKRNRLIPEVYEGFYAYSLSICTEGRARYFTEANTVNQLIEILRLSAEKNQFEVYTYCFMPDHLHLLLVGKSQDANLIKCMKDFKQQSGYWFKQKSGKPLWQKGYFDHVLRKEEQVDTVARYILDNPVRAELVKHFFEYPFSGSFVFDVKEML